MAKKEKEKRVCGYCQGMGHNQRTCPDKKAAEASGELASGETVTTSAPRETSLALLETPTSSPEPSNPGLVHQPIEFEEAIKQVHVNGTTLRLAVREFDAGIADLALRITRAGGKPQEVSFDQDVGAKTYEMLGWALQQIAARRNLKALPHRSQTNGQPVATR
jgi:hypothetical protein